MLVALVAWTLKFVVFPSGKIKVLSMSPTARDTKIQKPNLLVENILNESCSIKINN